MNPEEETACEERVVEAGRIAWRDLIRHVGSMVRACTIASDAEAAGVVGAVRLLGNIPDVDTDAVELLLKEPVRLGLLTPEEAARAFRGQD
jgi:hypothetical protein